MSNVSSEASSNARSVGRSAGTTIIQKKTDEVRLIATKNEIAEKYNRLKELAAKKGIRVKPGTLNQIIQSVKAMRGVTATISPQAIRRRIHRKSLVTHHVAGGQVTPLLRIEPLIVEIILQMARIRQCLNPSKGLQLVNSLIKGTKIQDELVEWKKRNTPNNTGALGTGYWHGFLRRHRTKLVS